MFIPPDTGLKVNEEGGRWFTATDVVVAMLLHVPIDAETLYVPVFDVDEFGIIGF